MTTTKDSSTEGTRSAGALPDLRYSDAEEQLRAVVRDLLADRSPWPDVLARVDAGEADDLPLWQALAADLGCAGLLIPERDGGAGASFREVCSAAEALGSSVAPVPFIGSAVVATAALLSVASGIADDAAAARAGVKGVPEETEAALRGARPACCAGWRTVA